MSATIDIHVMDWNDHDRVITVSKADALAILRDTSKSPWERMQSLYELAVLDGNVIGDPRASQMDEADMFLGWPTKDEKVLGYPSPAQWQHDLDEELANLE